MKCIIVYYAYDDWIAADSYLSKFLNEDMSFPHTKEAEFLQEIITAGKEMNQDLFQDAVNRYKKISDLDYWMIEMLSRILAKFERKDNMLGAVEEDYR